MSDNSPVIKIKAAMQKIQNEIKIMDVRIGILNHTVMTHRYADKKNDDGYYEGNVLDEFD